VRTDGPTLPTPSGHPRPWTARSWERLVAPSPRLDEPADRLRARLLAGLLAVIVPVGLLSGVVQLAVVPGFLPTFLTMCGALGALALAYAASRTSQYRIGGAIAAVAPIAACLAVVVNNPDDRVWYAFMALGVLLASAFLSLAATAAVAALSFGGILVVVAAVPELQDPARFVPPLAFHAVFSPLMLLAARHRDRLEEERRRSLLATQVAFAESQRLETVGRLAGGIAHDFNNLLTVVFANVAALRRGAAAGGPELDEISEAADRSSALVRQLLAFARRQVLAPRVLSPADVLAGMDRILRHLVGPRVALSVDRPAAIGLVRVDPGQLEQVVLNLLVNARDAMPRGGTVRIRLRDVHVVAGGPEAREGVAPGEHVAIEVADEGTGMTDEVRRRAFEPFFTTKEPGQGSGIGLATVHGIVSQSGGHVTVHTAPGRGSTFTVYLPRVAPPASPPLPAAPPPGSCLLVVDDDAGVRRSLARALADVGFEVIQAGDVDEATRLCGGRSDLRLVVTDAAFSGRGGARAIRALRASAPAARILVVSASGPPALDDEVAPLLEDVQVLAKPFSPEALVRTVREILAAAPAAPP